MVGRKIHAIVEGKILRTNQGDVISGEFWIVVFFDRVSGTQQKLYTRVGSLMNAIEDHFGWKYTPGMEEKDLPEFHVWHVDLVECTVKPVEGPLWR